MINLVNELTYLKINLLILMSQEYEDNQEVIVEEVIPDQFDDYLENEFEENFHILQTRTCIDLCKINVWEPEIPRNKLNEFEICIRKFNKLIFISSEKSEEEIIHNYSDQVKKGLDNYKF